jgi:hypothetical protein
MDESRIVRGEGTFAIHRNACDLLGRMTESSPNTEPWAKRGLGGRKLGKRSDGERWNASGIPFQRNTEHLSEFPFQ